MKKNRIIALCALTILTIGGCLFATNYAYAYDPTLPTGTDEPGTVPLCMKKQGTGDMHDNIPFCVDGLCKRITTNQGKLDVNYCWQDPTGSK